MPVRLVPGLRCAVGLVLVGLPYVLQAQPWGRGPFRLSTQYPFVATHLSFAPDTPQVLDVHESSLDVLGTWSSTSVLEDGYAADAESAEALLGYARGLGGGIQIALDLPLVWRGGGRLDDSIDKWHKFFSLPRGDRRALGSNDFKLSGNNQDGSKFDLSAAGMSLGNAVLRTRFLVAGGSTHQPALSYELGAGLPTARGDFGQRGIDLSQALLASIREGGLIFYSGAAHIWYSDTEISGLHYAANHGEGFVGIEYEATSALSLILSTSLASAIVKEVTNHPDLSVYLDLGAKYELDGGRTLGIGLRENPFPGDGTTDVTVFAGLEQGL